MKAILIFLCLMLLPVAALAQTDDPLMARLSAEKAGALEPGLYGAGEGRDDFILLPYRGKYLLRFSSAPENFVLTADPGSLGAKLLKYDTGAAALSVSVWGGVTLYVADAPDGLPATHRGDATLPAPAEVSAAELKTALSDEAGHFSYAHNLGLRFTADATLLGEADSRAMAFDTLANVQAGIERFLAASAQAHQALGHRVAAVKLERASKPGLALNGRSLVVRFAPAQGFLGRQSSHALAHQLGKLLAVETPE